MVGGLARRVVEGGIRAAWPELLPLPACREAAPGRPGLAGSTSRLRPRGVDCGRSSARSRLGRAEPPDGRTWRGLAARSAGAPRAPLGAEGRRLPGQQDLPGLCQRRSEAALRTSIASKAAVEVSCSKLWEILEMLLETQTPVDSLSGELNTDLCDS